MVGAHFLTKEGLKHLEQEMVDLKEKRKEVADRIEEAIKMGDLSENAEYSDAKDEQAFIEGRIAEIDQILKNAEIIKKPKKNLEEVVIGCTVKVKINGGEKDFMIVGPEEVDITTGKISHESPIGKSLLGKKRGESISVQTPVGNVSYKVVDIK